MYEWVKALHIIAVVAWFAGLFYLPRLFVYHSGHSAGALHEQFCVMERKLYRFIMWPAMVLVLLFGTAMALMNWDYLVESGWFHAKMVVVSALVAFHFHCGCIVRALAAGQSRHSERFFRLYNELPTLGLVLAVILVVVRPF